MSNPTSTITVDILPNGSVNVWTQKKDRLTSEQEERFQELLRKIEQATVRQLTIQDG